MTKVMQHKKGTIQPAEAFHTLNEEAAYWDTHDTTEDVSAQTPVGFQRAKKTEILPVRFAPEDLHILKQKAHEQGVGTTTLARMIILKNLRQQSHR
jgi:predicted DNA binding CopG/RHH family protein